jgi:hypothetical protein
MADFDFKKYLIESKINIKVPVKEMARIAKEKYKLNTSFPDIKDRIKNPTNYKTDRKQQVINYFIAQAEEQGIKPFDVELLKSDIEKNAAPGVNWSFTPDIRNQLLTTTTPKTAAAPEDEEGTFFGGADDAEDLFIGKSKLKTKKAPTMTDDEDEKEPSAKDLIKAKKSPSPVASRAGKFFDDNSDLIAKIIKQYATSTMKTGRAVKEAEDGGMSSADFKLAQQKSKDVAKNALPDLLQKLVDEIEAVKKDDYSAYVKVLNDLDKYKFTPTNTKNVLKQILKALGEPSLPAIGSKRKDSEEDELKKLGIDDEPINIDDEEEI